MRSEIRIFTDNYVGNEHDKDVYSDHLISALARFGYSPYYTDVGDICFIVHTEESVHDIRNVNEDLKIENQIL